MADEVKRNPCRLLARRLHISQLKPVVSPLGGGSRRERGITLGERHQQNNLLCMPIRAFFVYNFIYCVHGISSVFKSAPNLRIC